jgi:hypothetical protein
MPLPLLLSAEEWTVRVLLHGGFEHFDEALKLRFELWHDQWMLRILVLSAMRHGMALAVVAYLKQRFDE